MIAVLAVDFFGTVGGVAGLEGGGALGVGGVGVVAGEGTGALTGVKGDGVALGQAAVVAAVGTEVGKGEFEALVKGEFGFYDAVGAGALVGAGTLVSAGDGVFGELAHVGRGGGWGVG